ncbi:hypothetical protein M6I34_11130 [Burkholderiaceae bacterium FT117]|uniref:hypothetical protein n=1 Tax=Zeimonas sediminis TaxID=2944268 RepID=UPI0023431C67|nr:hypothetical protein [Zeimonas sediminis]MCM5571058.1 hypothetical protein [Zeimonas sediminis]
MKHAFFACLALAAGIGLQPVSAHAQQPDKELRDQRNAAQKERREQKRDRDQALNDARRDFQEQARAVEQDYREKLRQVDVEFELRRVQLQAEHDANVAKAEAEFQKRLSDSLMSTSAEPAEARMAKMESAMKSLSAEMFRIRKQAAGKVHQERLAVERRKHALLKEQDQALLAKAESMGLARDPEPILAKPIGGELTRDEQRWNDGERKHVASVGDRNRKSLAKYRNGDKLRAFDLANMEEDFAIDWEERAELQALQSERTLFSTMMMGGQADLQALTARAAELGEKEKLVKIEYDKRRKEKAIERREARRKLAEE